MNYTFSIGDKFIDPTFPRMIHEVREIQSDRSDRRVIVERIDKVTDVIFPMAFYSESVLLEYLQEGAIEFIYKKEKSYLSDEFSLLRNLW